MQIIVPITPATQDLVAAMNDGVRPEIDPTEDTYFVYNGPEEHSDIISTEQKFWANGTVDFDMTVVYTRK